MLLTLLALLAVTPAADPEPNRETEAVAACEDWWRPLNVNDPATAASVSGNGLCINGFIDKGTDAAVVGLIESTSHASPLIVVVRSGGGEFDAAMNVAEALQERPTTVIADMICASSCADYIVVAARRRIVLDDTFLVYHGGVTMRLLDQARPQIEALAKADPTVDPAAAMSQMQAMVTAQIARQDAFMARAGVKPEIFAWMDEANAPANAALVARCPAGSHVIQYSEKSLARFGLTFDHYGAPRSQTEVDALLRKLGRDSKICYWRE